MQGVCEVPAPLPHDALPGADWADAWQAEVKQSFTSAREAAEAIIENFPAWTGAMMALRQILVAPFGLKGRPGSGDRIGIFPVVSESRQQLVAGFNDRHLDFRIVVDLEEQAGKPEQAVTLTTVIKRHNLLGRIYLVAVMPFHRAIISTALRRIREGRG
ncbi:MAG: DUF2867 domain-containing protein [Nitratireductor sp.]|nr:DUF2867 domain-containing protein [Nitratireductor sp.]